MSEEWFVGVWDSEDGQELAPGFKDAAGNFWKSGVMDKAPYMMRADSPPHAMSPMPKVGGQAEKPPLEVQLKRFRDETCYSLDRVEHYLHMLLQSAQARGGLGGPGVCGHGGSTVFMPDVGQVSSNGVRLK